MARQAICRALVPELAATAYWAPDLVSHGLLEQRHFRTLGEKIRLKHADHCVNVRLGDMLSAIRNHNST